MKNRYGCSMNTYGNILPGAGKLSKIPKLSKEAKRRLKWMDWYDNHGNNASKTMRHFGLSPDVFYRWKNRYNPYDLTSLEDDKITRTPHKIRQSENRSTNRKKDKRVA